MSLNLDAGKDNRYPDDPSAIVDFEVTLQLALRLVIETLSSTTQLFNELITYTNNIIKIIT